MIEILVTDIGHERIMVDMLKKEGYEPHEYVHRYQRESVDPISKRREVTHYEEVVWEGFNGVQILMRRTRVI